MIFISNWLFFSWIVFHKKTIITKHDNYANDLYTEPKISLIQPNITDGKDNHIITEAEDEIEKNTLFKIRQNKLKGNQLQLLEKPSLSIIEKLLIVKEIEKDDLDSIYVSNIHKGGLWKDWE
jgi:hypothetical protein